MTVQEEVRTLLTERRQRAAGWAAAMARLQAMPPEAWPRIIATDTALHDPTPLHAILDHVMKVEVFRNATTALRLTNAVLDLAADVVVRGRAMRLRADVLHRRGKGVQARRVIKDAIAMLQSAPAGALELLHARLFHAYLRSETGEGDVLLEIRVIAKTFAAHGDARGALRARLIEAAILHNRREFERAIVVNLNAASIAASLHDEQSEAIGYHNAGHCAEQLAGIATEKELPLRARAHAQDALSYLAKATPRYAALHMDGESQKILWAMASLARQYGDLEDARAQLIAVRAALLDRELFLPAALVAVDIMELLIMADRTQLAMSWYDETMKTLQSAGMPDYALVALERVRAAAHDGRIDADFLATVRSAVREEFDRAA